ncbi:hypothetical protein GCM10007425_07350 [Lysinibacillus alkalisoli]|uniref:Methyl-accepting chemotaxis protein n=1 Tax=Lysinibacillus alkalisoli TaxID=1911548 RepID=A0A917FZZ5_9BACI|nr:hypothetical protein [Lysinibacillus alkalisoli]GGG15583.1 hypothetical protein GCM10007425_07350 [Lysinibacillus alkalisoli]
MKKKRVSINTKLSVAFLLALLVPTILIASNAFFAAKNEITTQIENSAKQSMQTLEDVIQQYVDPIVKKAAYFGKTIDIETEDKVIILERLTQYYETSDDTVS